MFLCKLELSRVVDCGRDLFYVLSVGIEILQIFERSKELSGLKTKIWLSERNKGEEENFPLRSIDE